jgi:sterol desaturase/sphingolipid hydroxylase (fatty acid hydroxylase superfamily)
VAEGPFLVAGLVMVGALLFLLERVAALRRASRPLLARLFVNACVAALAFATSTWLVRPAAASTLQWAWGQPFGVLHIVPMAPAARFVLSFLLMDLTFYWWHVANHRVPFLWRFHNVHHIDPDLDVSTAFRFHPGEVALSAGFRVLQISAIGLSAGMFAAYELVFQANTLFHHSNVRLPIGLERWLNVMIVTPRMHGIHHSQIRDEAQSNYSVVLPWWDRLHRTLGLNVPQSEIAIGVPAYSNPADNTVWDDLLLPFGRQRDYWRRPDGTIVERNRATSRGDPSRLAE